MNVISPEGTLCPRGALRSPGGYSHRAYRYETCRNRKRWILSVPTHSTGQKSRLPGSSRHQQEYVVDFSTPAPAKGQSPTSSASCSPIAPKKPLHAGQVPQCRLEICSLTDEWVTLLWCNPPYDEDRHGDEKRPELAFLKSSTPKLVRDGVPAAS